MTTDHDHPHPHPHERGTHPKRRPHHHEHDEVTPHPHVKRPEPLHHPLVGVYVGEEPPPDPDPDPDPDPEPEPEVPPIEVPASPDVVVRAGDNVASKVNNAPAGSAILIDGRFPLAGQVIVGDGKTVYGEELGAADLVAGAYRGTGIALRGGKALNLRIGDGLRSGAQLSAGLLRGFEIYGCAENGMGSNRDVGVVVEDGEMHDCGSDAAQGHNAGGMKLTASGDRGRGPAAQVRRVKAYRVKGNGFWHDVDSGNCRNYRNGELWPAGEKDQGENPNMRDTFDGDFYGWAGAAVFEDCEAWECDARGFFWEVSRGPIVMRRLKAHHCNVDRLGNGAGIGVSAAKNALIEDCESWDNYGSKDIWTGQVTREGDRPWEPGYYIVRGVVIRRNGVGGLSRIGDNVDGGVTYADNYVRAA